jgi:hypothetical protein
VPLTKIFNKSKECKEHNCKIDKRDIKAIFKPDNGFLDKDLEKSLFPPSYKICDCILVCQNSDIMIVEILCGTLTFSEFKDKSKQLENCCRVLKNQNLNQKIKKIILLHKSMESKNKNPQFRKKLINPKICSIPLELSTNPTYAVKCL